MLNEATRLHGEGFAVHWLRPKSKQPVGSGWTKGPRKKLEDVKRLYKEGFNVGVRLGSASRFPDGTFLCCIDCDVKSSDPVHHDEMLEALRGVLTEAEVRSATVESGRGNGSRHIYLRSKNPFKGRTLASSTATVKVKMPSVQPSKVEKDTLTADELKDGIRLRSAWEIDSMSEGRQTVLPPSIHPDSGKAYQWAIDFKGWEALAVVDENRFCSAEKKRDQVAAEVAVGEVVDVDLDKCPENIRDAIEFGSGVEDRSAFLLPAACAMLQAGYKDPEILSVLTDPSYYLGQVAYDHGRTSRRSAMEWVARYTLKKAKESTLAAFQFDVIPDEGPVTIDDDPSAWKAGIERNGNGGIPKNTMSNVALILENEVGHDLFRFDQFAFVEMYGRPAPWGGSVGQSLDDSDALKIKAWIADKYRMTTISVDTIHEAMSTIAHKNEFHPVLEYMGGLTWDGTPRLDNWLVSYLNAQGDPAYLRAVGRKTIIAMVARVLCPGVKWDYVPIFEGPQGCGKSTTIRALAGDAWFTDAPLTFRQGSADDVLAMKAKWILELGELAGLDRADAEAMKAFVTRQVDEVRMPYGRRRGTHPRQCIFIGTTNNFEYLRDESGNRRFWPVHVGDCDFEAVARDRDQLIAEAAFIWENMGECLFLEDQETQDAARHVQADRVVHDVMQDQIFDMLDAADLVGEIDKDRFTMDEFYRLAHGPNGLPLGRDIQDQRRIGRCLRLLGYEKRTARTGGRLAKTWLKGSQFRKCILTGNK